VTEPDLIARVLAGDRLAARALYDAHVGRVHRLAYRLTGDEHMAHEVTQDTFVKALSQLDRFRGESALATWLHRITVSVALNATRRAKRRHGREAPIEDADAVVADDGEGVDPVVRDRLHRAIDALPEIYRPRSSCTTSKATRTSRSRRRSASRSAPARAGCSSRAAGCARRSATCSGRSRDERRALDRDRSRR
jgi:RNA polymerase sigma-70 factor (ECF subfamily)